MIGVKTWWIGLMGASVMNAFAQSGEVQQALQVLLEPVGGVSMKHTAPAATGTAPAAVAMVRATSSSANDALASGRPTVVVPRGMTAVRLLADVQRRSRLSNHVLLQAFLHLNPHAFIGGNVNRLKAGVTVAMFTDDDVRRLTSGQPLDSRGSVSSPEDRRNWIRYP